MAFGFGVRERISDAAKMVRKVLIRPANNIILKMHDESEGVVLYK